MVEQFLKQEVIDIIKEIHNDSSLTQRELAKRLGISLGKINYILNALIQKGFIKARNFSNNPGKLRKINYTLTKKGLEERLALIQHFLQKKEAEYNMLKEELAALSAK